MEFLLSCRSVFSQYHIFALLTQHRFCMGMAALCAAAATQWMVLTDRCACGSAIFTIGTATTNRTDTAPLPFALLPPPLPLLLLLLLPLLLLLLYCRCPV